MDALTEVVQSTLRCPGSARARAKRATEIIALSVVTDHTMDEQYLDSMPIGSMIEVDGVRWAKRSWGLTVRAHQWVSERGQHCLLAGSVLVGSRQFRPLRWGLTPMEEA